MIKLFKSPEVISLIGKLVPENPVIVEAGAFTGHDTIRMAKQWPNGIIHAFEPVPELYLKLKNETAHLPNVHCYNLALSDQNGSAIFYWSEKPTKPGVSSQAGSLHKPKERLKHSPIQFPLTIEVETITLDSWAAQQNIDHIDCLWLDMQGHELSVLKASPVTLKTVRVIYTEVSFIESYEGAPLLSEIKSWIEAQGFKEVGRDFENQTDWFFGNILFAR